MEDCAIKGISDCNLLDKVINDFKTVNYFWILMMTFAFALSNLSRSIRWNMLLKPLGYKPRLINSFLTIVLGYFANLGLPRVGELVRVATLSKYENLSPEKVMGTVVVDRIIDVISILIVTGIVLILEYDRIWGYFKEQMALGDKIQGFLSSNIFFTFIGIVILIIAGLFIFRKKIGNSNIFKRIKKLFIGFAEGIKTVSKLDRPWLFLFHSINIWFMYFMMMYLTFFSFGPTAHLTALAALTVFVTGGWGIVIPSPGGMGTFHLLVVAVLAMYGINGDDAFSFANINFFSVQIGSNILIGILALIFLPIINKHYKPKQSDQ